MAVEVGSMALDPEARKQLVEVASLHFYGCLEDVADMSPVRADGLNTAGSRAGVKRCFFFLLFFSLLKREAGVFRPLLLLSLTLYL